MAKLKIDIVLLLQDNHQVSMGLLLHKPSCCINHLLQEGPIELCIQYSFPDFVQTNLSYNNHEGHVVNN